MTWASDLAWLYEHPDVPVAVDTETTGLRVDDGRHYCIGVSIAWRDGDVKSLYIPVAHTEGDNARWDVLDQLEWILSMQGRRLIFANWQFDANSLRTAGIDVRPCPFYDVPTMANMVDEDWPKTKSLDLLAVRYLDSGERKVAVWPWQTKDEKGRVVKESTLKWQKENGWPHTTPEMMDKYARVDAEITLLVWEALMRHRLWREQPVTVWAHKEEFIRECLLPVRERGVLLNMDLVLSELAVGEAEKARLQEEMGFNPASWNDNYRVWIEELGFPVLKWNKPSAKALAKNPEAQPRPSFDKTVMAEYDLMLERTDSPLAKQVKAYRGWQTAVGLLLRPYSKFVSPDGRLRTNYLTHSTSTGRLSSREPNLQQISKEADYPWKKNIKRCFVARPGYTLLSADYSQLEFRLATAHSQEETLTEIFADPSRDVFTEMAEALEMARQDVKTLTYSILYGAGIPRIMNAFGVSKERAQEIRDNFYSNYPRFRALNRYCDTKAKDELRIRNWTGRIRHFKHKSESYKAMNALIQGGAADIVERVWLHVMRELDSEECITLLQVHDALVFEVKTEKVEEYKVRIAEMMADVQGITGMDFPVRFAVDVSEWALAA